MQQADILILHNIIFKTLKTKMKGTQQMSREDGTREKQKTCHRIPFGINPKDKQRDVGGGEAFHSNVETGKDF